MKKILYGFICTLTFVFATNYVYALDEETNENETTSTTTEEADTTKTVTNVRTMFIEQYLAKKTILADLRTQTEAARKENNELVAQIKQFINNKERTAIQTKIANIEQLRTKIQSTISEAKTYVAEKQEIKNKIAEAIKNGEAVSADELTSQREEVIGKLTTYKTTLDGYREDLKKAIEELKLYRAEQQDKYKEIKALYLEIKNTQVAIKEKEQLKNEKWTEFRAAIEDKNYGKAIEAFDSIIEYKTAILNNLKEKNTLLKELITKYENE